MARIIPKNIRKFTLHDNSYNSTTKLKGAVRSFKVEIRDAIVNCVSNNYLIIENKF